MSTLYPFVRTETGAPPPVQPATLTIVGNINAIAAPPTAACSGLVSAGGSSIVGTIAASVVSPTCAASGTVAGGGGQFLPGYLEAHGIFNQDYLVGQTRTQYLSQIL